MKGGLSFTDEWDVGVWGVGVDKGLGCVDVVSVFVGMRCDSMCGVVAVIWRICS